MINASGRYIENRTNVLLFARSKTYLFQDYCVDVYDFPINQLITPTDAEATSYELFTKYETSNTSNTELVLNVGYSNPADVPDDLKQAMLELVKFMYYEAETNEAKKGMLPMWLEEMIDMNKRFII